MNGSLGEGRVADDRAVERERGGHALDDDLVQRAPGPLQRLVTGRAGDDELGQQRVEVAADDVAGVDAGVDPYARAGGQPQRGDGAGGGQEVAARVLAVDPELDGVAARRAGRR